ncbi:MAG TPA: hypothetical protein VFH95_01465 [Candidatus Kapabacteria bacterium]|nr:hypothetical protein [Candidatus Kapabacteria bacterium]
MNIPPQNEWVPLLIPTSALLLRRASFRHYDGSQFTPAAMGMTDADWANEKPGLSVNWEDYSSIERTRSNKQYDLRYFGVLTLASGCADAIAGRKVVHDPDRAENNYAHSEIRALRENREREKTTDVHLLLECSALYPVINPDARLFLPLPIELFQSLHNGATSGDLLSYFTTGVRCCNHKENATELLAQATNDIWLLELDLTRISKGTQFTVKHDGSDVDKRFPILCITKLKNDTFASCRLSEELISQQ